MISFLRKGCSSPSLRRGEFSLFVFLLFSFSIGFSQSFPVQVIPQAVPPAPIYLSDYADPSTINSPLRVQIILNDLTITNREIRLKAYFEGNGLAFQSNDIVVGADPLFLEGGIPLTLTNVELAPYFQFENISGIPPTLYGQPIPEGAYQFCFEVMDVLTGNRLSQRSCATIVVFQNEPPFLISPYNKSNIEERNPQNIVFQWTPRHINVSNVEYELSIVEIWDNQVDPQQAFLSSPPVFQTTTNATTYVYGPADPLFLSGKNYAWRVQAKAKQGTEEIGLFKNQGYSEIFSFSYAGSCDIPISIGHEVKGSTNANIFWDDFTTEVPEFTVRYREKGNASNEWFLSKTTTNGVTLWDLKAGTAYEYQVQKTCTITESDWSTLKEFTTFIADDEASVYNCGISPNINLSNQEPLSNILINDVFTAGDFPVRILEVSGSNGRFTGKGYVTVPYLNSIKVGVEFTNVLINTDKQLAEGTVVTVYDPSLGNLLDVDDIVDTIDDITDTVGEIFEGDNDLDEIRVNFPIPEDQVDEIIKVENGQVTITNPANGATVTEPIGDDKVVVDSDGQVYHIDTGGNITAGGQIDAGGAVNSGNVDGVSNNGDIKELTAKGIVITFEDTEKYGFDTMPSSQKSRLQDHYETIKDGDGNDYTLIHQAVKKGNNVKVTAIVDQTSANYELSEIVFKTKQGEKIPAEIKGNNTIELTLTGTYTFENELIYAVVPSKEDSTKQLTAGAFRLWHLTERAVDVTLVSVNGANIPSSVKTGVASIFEKGVADINFTSNNISLQFDKNQLGGNGLDIGESPWLTAYNEEQKQVIAALTAAQGYRKESYYILVFDDIKPSKSIAGFMPLQRQFGFIFSGDTSANEEGKGNLSNTVAHEIAHGVFALQHPFAQLGTQEGQTNWLMDYSNGTLLNHLDWAQIHNPDLKFYVFQDEEQGEIANKIWFTPEWIPFTVKDTRTIISDKIDNIPNGTIPGFKLDGKYYYSQFEETQFLGYFYNYDQADQDKYGLTEIANLDSDAEVYLFQYNGGCGYNRYYKTKHYYVNANKNNINFGSDTNVEFMGTIPCSQNSSGNKNPFKASICEYVPQDKDINAYGVEKAVEKLNQAHALRKSITDTKTPREKGKFYHLVNVSENDLDGKAEAIEDKLYQLKQKTGIDFYVVFQPIDTKMTGQARDAFAQKVLDDSGVSAADKAVLITVPYYSLNPLASFAPINCIQPGFAQNSNTLVLNKDYTFKTADNLFEYVLGAYAGLEKPLFIRRYFLKANSSLVSTEIQTQSGKTLRGYPFINQVDYYESPELPDIRESQYIIGLTSPQNDPEYDIASFQELRNGWIENLNELFVEAEKAEINAFKANDLSYWGEKQKIEIGKFRDFYIQDIELTNVYVATNVKGTYLESWKILFGNSKIEPKHLYDFDVWTVVDQTVYSGLDVISLVPGLDTFSDFSGVIYAGVRGDLENTLIYSASLAVPFAGSGYLKGIKNGINYADDAFAITAKKVSGKVEFEVKKIADVDAGELQVSTILTNDKDIADKIAKEDLDNYINKDDVGKLLDEFASVGITSIDNLIDLVDDVYKSFLKRDLEEAPELFDFFKNDLAKLEAWKIIHKSIHSIDINAINYVDKIKDGALVGRATSIKYKETWRAAFPNLQGGEPGKYFNIHHAIEQQVIDSRWPGLFDELEIHSLENLRGISGELNTELHLKAIRNKWDEFYDRYPPGSPAPTKKEILDYVTEIDDEFGKYFSPPIRSLD